MIRVTETLKPFIDFSMIPEDTLLLASERGTKVHKICSCYAKGLPWLMEIPPECEGYVLSFKNWFDKQVAEVLLVEERLFDEALGFSGMPDLIVKMKTEGIVLVDLKTPVALQKAWQVQISSYLHLARKKFKIEKAGTLQLSPDGKAAKMTWLKKEEETRAFTVFLSALNCHNYFNG